MDFRPVNRGPGHYGREARRETTRRPGPDRPGPGRFSQPRESMLLAPRANAMRRGEARRARARRPDVRVGSETGTGLGAVAYIFMRVPLHHLRGKRGGSQ